MQPPAARGRARRNGCGSRLPRAEVATIGTDHCDYTIAQKCAHPEFTRTAGRHPWPGNDAAGAGDVRGGAGRISWTRLVEVTSTNPARLFGLERKGALAQGSTPTWWCMTREERTVTAAGLHNLAGYTPWEGLRVQGAVRDVYSCAVARWYATVRSSRPRGGAGLWRAGLGTEVRNGRHDESRELGSEGDRSRVVAAERLATAGWIRRC